MLHHVCQIRALRNRFSILRGGCETAASMKFRVPPSSRYRSGQRHWRKTVYSSWQRVEFSRPRNRFSPFGRAKSELARAANCSAAARTSLGVLDSLIAEKGREIEEPESRGGTTRKEEEKKAVMKTPLPSRHYVTRLES